MASTPARNDDQNCMVCSNACSLLSALAILSITALPTTAPCANCVTCLADSASFEITVTDIAKQGKLVKEIEGIDGVRKVNSSDETAKTLTNFNHLVSTASLFIIVILLVVSVFLISTTISVGISVRREEIAIMRLIGATDFFVQGPFIVEGILIGLIGALIPMGILVVIYFQLIHWLTEKFASLSDWLVFLSIGQECAVLLPVCLLIGIGIGLLGSCITVKKHLQV